MTVTKRLFLLVGVALSGTIGIGAIGLLAMERVRDSASYATVNSVPSYEVLDDTFQEFVDAASHVSLHVLSSDPAGKAALNEQLATGWTQMLATLAKYEVLLSDEQGRQLLAVDRAALADYDVQRINILAASSAGRREEAYRLLQASLPAVDKITDAFQAHRQYNHVLADAGEQAARRIYGQATWIVVGLTLLSIILSGIAAFLIIRTLKKQLGGELEYAANISRRIAAGDLEVRIDTRPDDKTSLLAAMKEMRDSLRATQAELVATARQAGRAEIATNVLHNVGNVLNSVNISASLVNNQIRNSKAAGLQRAAQLIDAHAADLGDFFSHDEKGRRLPEYLNKLADALATEQTSILEELGRLARSVEHIKDIVAVQQSHGNTVRLVEPVQIRDLLDDALRINADALTRQETSVIKDYAEVPVLPLDKHRLLQILVNLISNAGQAMAAPNGRPQRITLRVGMVDATDSGDGAAGGGGVHRLQICVADEGDGISAENLARIFSHGFTTRTNGHGFGLHSCILAAREMGGTLTAQSDGPGLGATFTLELPITAGSKA
ncbi:MAG: MCP four helix bundle domain-containing protein [Rhodocyclaceae bacterium]